MVKAVLFDFDGTLANTADGIVLTMKETYRRMGLQVPDDEAVRQTIGIPLEKGIKMLGGLGSYTEFEAAAVYRELFPTFEVGHVSVFPHVIDTLKVLNDKGLRMAICTSRGYPSLEMIMQEHGLFGFFETFITVSDGLKPKPAPDMVLALLDRMGLDKDEAVVVGDTTFDIGMGNGAGCRTVAVTYGNHSREQLETAHPSHIIDDFEELIKLVSPLG